MSAKQPCHIRHPQGARGEAGHCCGSEGCAQRPRALALTQVCEGRGGVRVGAVPQQCAVLQSAGGPVRGGPGHQACAAVAQDLL